MTVSENIHQSVSLTEDEKLIVGRLFKQVTVIKNEFWIEEGKVCNHIAFVQSGKLRVFYHDTEGDEVTCYFAMPDSFISSYSSFLTNTSTKENISVMEDSVLQVISKKDLERLSEKIPKIHIWRRIITENIFIIMEKRIHMLQTQSAHERYENLMQENPEIVLTVPLQYTASYLGISPQHLSRLRKNLIT